MSCTQQTKPVHVAVGVIVNEQNKILIALRPQNIHLGGLWEFPGGKVEKGESVAGALARELKEELGISIKASRQLVEINHDYTDKSVLLDVWWVDKFTGVATGEEGQPIKWVGAKELSNYEFPEANKAIVLAVQNALD